jgi:hypothetical protein
MNEESIRQNCTMLHKMGMIVWHNTPKLEDIVVLDPQWLADAMAGVVTFISQDVVSKLGGTTNWQKLQEPLKLKYDHSPATIQFVNFIHRFPTFDAHKTILSLLEFFEIVFKLRFDGRITQGTSTDISDEQAFFVPSLLSPCPPNRVHPSFQYWDQLKHKYMLVFCGCCFVLFCFVLFCFVLFCFVLFCFVLFCFVLFC